MILKVKIVTESRFIKLCNLKLVEFLNLFMLNPRISLTNHLLKLLRILGKFEISLGLIKTQIRQLFSLLSAMFPDFVQKILNVELCIIRKEEFENVLGNTEFKHVWVDRQLDFLGGHRILCTIELN